VIASIHLAGVNLHYPLIAHAHRSLTDWFGRKITRNNGTRITAIHALKNISAEIGRGERVAVLGHNGAGKSTLLKTIAGVFPVSSGNIEVRGNVRSLFDISLGFEPDASGRANIFYRGLLMGLTPREIRAREAEIVSFADLGDFIDYPLSTYSTGMQVRLAFAISTFSAGDVLLLDEVIGAGDAAFMEKARRRITELIQQSEIMLLASHDLAAVSSLCGRALVLHRGALAFDGPVELGIERYRELNGLKHA
jgi:lipopolysaccharide transport system ATP-binding protein